MSTSQPVRGSHLTAVNTMLSAIGEMATTQAILDAGSSADVVMAKQILDEVNKEVQGQGWHFNTEYDVPLVPDAVGVGAQGMIQCEDDVDSGDLLWITDANGFQWKFTFTATTSYDTGDGTSSEGGTSYISVMSGDKSDVSSRAKFTTALEFAEQVVIGINLANAHATSDWKVTAVQVKEKGEDYGIGAIELDEYPTNHPEYMVDSSEVTPFDQHVRHLKNVLVTQDVVGASGNGNLINMEYQSTSGSVGIPADQLTTYPFGENGMRIGVDIGHITLGTDVARIDLEANNQGGLDPIMKYSGNDWKLYDKKERTFVFTSTVKASIVYFYDFIGLPHAAQQYITIKASRVLQDRTVGAQTLHAYSMNDEFRALADLRDWEGETADHSIFDSYSTYRTIKRGPVIT